MIKTKEIKKIKKSQLIIIGSLLIFLGIVIFSSKLIFAYILKKEETSKIQEFYKIEYTGNSCENKIEFQEKQENEDADKTNYIAVIKIPKIKIEKGLCKKESINNNVSKNIQILKESNYPDTLNGNFVLAGHSGSSRISYFENLDKLSLDDEASVLYKGKEYKYRVVNIYEIEKTGVAEIIRNKEKTTLTLITCKKNTNKQIIIVCELI